ncbi:hemolysin D [Planctomycetia bacterium]|nr:hemolysin D [Planctomycetia bacterium]
MPSPAFNVNAIIPWRLRRDVIARSTTGGDDAGWTLKDPLSLAYFRLREAEYAVFSRLDGRMTYGEVLEALRRTFPAESWSLENLKAFIGSLVQSGLLTSLLPGQGSSIAKQREISSRRARLGLLSKLLAFRWRGIDPEPLLRRVEPWTRWLFRPVTLAACASLIALAMLLVTLRWETLVRRLPDATALFGLGSLVPLVVVFIGIKLLHELGHVLTCRHFGGECHELGIQVLMFVPLFYGDVTDAWMVSRRWPRIAISAAGIFVELVLASVATLLWWSSVPGLLNSVFLNVMLVCSINTLLFNGNPLLRYDGYYVLADWLHLPNLAMQSRQTVMSLCERVITGVNDDDIELDSRRWWTLVIYGVLSAVYRLLVTVGIVWFLHHFFGRGLGVFASAISVLLVFGAVVSPMRELATRIRQRSKGQASSPRRLRNRLAICGVLLVAVLLIPLPYSVSAPFVLFPGDAQPVFVTVGGRIESAVPAGSRVRAGEPLGELVNHELSLQHEQRVAEVARLTARLKNLEAQRGNNESAAMRLPATRDELAGARRRLDQLTSEVQRLRLNSPSEGTVLPPPNTVRTQTSEDSLPEWHGTPLDVDNLGATVREQTLFCYVGDPARQDALLLVDQNGVEFVRPGQRVRLRFLSAPGVIREGRVEEIASARSEVVPRELSVAQLVPVRQSSNGLAPSEVSYEVRVRLLEETASQTSGAALYSPGKARIACGTLSLAARCWRLLRNTFSTELSSGS